MGACFPREARQQDVCAQTGKTEEGEAGTVQPEPKAEGCLETTGSEDDFSVTDESTCPDFK